MEIDYKSNKLEKSCTDLKEMKKVHNERAKKVKQRIDQFQAASDLSVIGNFPGLRCHQLSGNYNGHLAVNISGNWRMIFRPLHDPIPTKEDGGLDWSQVTHIEIVSIEDYH